MRDEQQLSTASRQTRTIGEWPEFLAAETERLDEFGVRAGMITVTICDDDVSPADAELLLERAERLLTHSLASTSRSSSTSDRTISILVAPIDSLSSLDRTARTLATHLSVAGFDSTVGFAHRRVDEHLTDTWARADAEADRARFRLRNPGGGLRLR